MQSIPLDDLDLVPAAEAAEILDIDRATLTRWAQSGKLPTALKAPGLRGSRFFRRADVETLLAELEAVAS